MSTITCKEMNNYITLLATMTMASRDETRLGSEEAVALQKPLSVHLPFLLSSAPFLLHSSSRNFLQFIHMGGATVIALKGENEATLASIEAYCTFSLWSFTLNAAMRPFRTVQ